MTSRTVLGNLVNQANQQDPVNGKQISMTNWFKYRGSNNKENVVENVPKSHVSLKPVQKPKQSRTPRIAVKKSNKKLCEEKDYFMDVEVIENHPVLALPEGVINIDDANREDVNVCGEYAREIHAYLKQLEAVHPIRDDFLHNCNITSKMRSLLIDWLVSVQMQFELHQETLFLSIGILDRYLQKEGKNIHRDQLQLVGVTSMLIASKIEEIYIPAIDDFVYSTDNAYNDTEIKEMELTIMQTLNFHLISPISLSFLRRYSKAGDVDVLEHSVSKYILELSLMDYGQAAIPASMSAAASLYLSLLLLEPPTSSLVWNSSLEFYSGYTSANLMPVVERMANVLINAKSHRLQAVRSKYSSRKYRRVAQREELMEEYIMKRVQLE